MAKTTSGVYDGDDAAEQANKLIDENDDLRAQLADCDAELAALREALEMVEWIPTEDGYFCERCHILHDYIDNGMEIDPTWKHAPDCPRQLALSGERAAQLAEVLKAAREVERTQRIPGWERTPEEIAQHSAERKHWLIVLGDAVRAAYPELGV